MTIQHSVSSRRWFDASRQNIGHPNDASDVARRVAMRRIREIGIADVLFRERRALS